MRWIKILQYRLVRRRLIKLKEKTKEKIAKIFGYAHGAINLFLGIPLMLYMTFHFLTEPAPIPWVSGLFLMFLGWFWISLIRDVFFTGEKK